MRGSTAKALKVYFLRTRLRPVQKAVWIPEIDDEGRTKSWSVTPSEWRKLKKEYKSTKRK